MIMKKIMCLWVLFMGLFVGMMYGADLPLICPVSGGAAAGAHVGVCYCDLLFSDTWYCGFCQYGVPVESLVYEWAGCVDPESHADLFVYVRLNGCDCNHGQLFDGVWWDCSNCSGSFDYEAFLAGEGGGGSGDEVGALALVVGCSQVMLGVVSALVAALVVVMLLVMSPAFLRYAYRKICDFMR
jgi:hypothetical protein